MAVTASGERSTFVVANSLAAQQWEMHLAAAEIGGGAPAWATPPVATYAAWLDGLWSRHCADRGEPLAVGQSAALWRRVIAESKESGALIGQAGAAEWAAEAWTLLHRWQLDPAEQRTYSDQIDYRAFLTWCRGYRERVAAHGWTDRAELEATLGGRTLAGADNVVAADLGEPFPARTVLFAQLQAHGRTVSATTAPPVEATRRAAKLADAADELRAAFAWAQRLLAEQPRARIAIVVPDAARRHDEIERLLAAMGSPSIPIGWGEGRTLAGEPVIGAALDALTLLAPHAPYAQLGRWLRSPFFAAAAPERFARAKLDRRLRMDLITQLPFATAYRCGLKERLEQETPLSAAAVAAALATLGDARRAVPSRWAYVFTRVLAAIGWQPPATRAALLGWQNSLDELARLTPILGDVALDAALAELERILARPGPTVLPLSGIHVLRRIDDVGPGYAGVWVAGFTDAAWPETPHGNPLVPLSVQREHAMPFCSPRDAEERSARAFSGLLQRTPDLVVSWPARVYDYETEPSPAIRDWPLLTAANLEGLATTRPAGSAVARETVTDSAPPLGATHLPGGTGALRRQARCPLRAFCQDRLGARELEPLRFGVSALLRGNATHRAAELLLSDLPPQSALVGREGAVGESVEHALTRWFGRARAPLTELFALEAEQLERVLVALLREEANRAPFRVLAVEQRTECALGRWTLTTRIDRIDELADGSSAIIDYKTSGRIKSSDWFSARLRDAQVPLYASHATGRVSAAVIAQLTPSATTYSGFWRDGTFPGRPNKFAREQADEQIAVWRAQLLELATELAGGDTRIFLADYEDATKAYAPLTRVFEQLALARGAAARW